MLALRSEMGWCSRAVFHRGQCADASFREPRKRCDQQYPELSVLPRQVKATQAILDGEIAVLDDKGRSSFSLIQPRISVSDANTIAHLARSTPVNLFLFDLLYLDGYDLRGATLEERKRLLAEIVTPSERIHVSDYFTVDGAAMLEAARAHGLEGIVAKGASEQIRRPPQPRLAEGEDQHHGRIRHRRLHAWRARLLQLAGAGTLRWRKAGACRASGNGIQRQVAQRDLLQNRAADHEEKPLLRNRQGAARCDVGEAGTGGRDQVSGNHSGWIAARAGVCRAARPTRIRKSACATDGRTAEKRVPAADPARFASRGHARNREAIASSSPISTRSFIPAKESPSATSSITTTP